MTELSRSSRSGAILVIDDEIYARDALILLLERHGYTVLAAADGSEALLHLNSDVPVALILLDLKMPGMSGWEFRQRQLADARWAGIPTVVLSGLSLSPTDLATLQIRSAIEKPYSLEEVLRFARAYV